MAKYNKVKLDERLLDDVDVEDKDVHAEKAGMLSEWLSSCSLMTMSLIICFNWLVVSMVYYGLSLNVQNLSGNIYVNFTIGAGVETLAYLGVFLLLDRIGRKLLHCCCMLIGGLSCIGTIFPVLYGSAAHAWITILLANVGRIGVSAAFSIVYVYTSELYPTVMRNTGLSAASFCARIGGIVSPYIADLGIIVGGDLKVALPLIVFGGFSLTAGLLSLKLPETKGKTLPETVEDSKYMGRQKPVYKEVSTVNSNQEEHIPIG